METEVYLQMGLGNGERARDRLVVISRMQGEPIAVMLRVCGGCDSLTGVGYGVCAMMRKARE